MNLLVCVENVGLDMEIKSGLRDDLFRGRVGPFHTKTIASINEGDVAGHN